MTRFEQLPRSSPSHAVYIDYVPYSQPETDEALLHIFPHLQVRAISAVLYHCVPNFRMAERRIGDDMFYYFVRGRGNIGVDGRTHAVAAGDCVLFPRGQPQWATSDPAHPFEVVSLHLDAELHASLSLFQVVHFPDVMPIGPESAIAKLFLEACREYALGPPGWELSFHAHTVELLLGLIREFNLVPRQSPPAAQMMEIRRLLPALDVMRADLAHPPAMVELARLCGLSPAQFRRVFQRALGSAPVVYLRRLRMEEAARLLRHTDATLDAIADRVGYADPSFFSHSFRRYAGVSPGRYRRTPVL